MVFTFQFNQPDGKDRKDPNALYLTLYLINGAATGKNPHLSLSVRPHAKYLPLNISQASFRKERMM